MNVHDIEFHGKKAQLLEIVEIEEIEEKTKTSEKTVSFNTHSFTATDLATLITGLDHLLLIPIGLQNEEVSKKLLRLKKAARLMKGKISGVTDLFGFCPYIPE